MVETETEKRPIRPRPEGSARRFLNCPCPRCKGTGVDDTPLPPGEGDALDWACGECHGVGWITMAHKLCIYRYETSQL